MPSCAASGHGRFGARGNRSASAGPGGPRVEELTHGLAQLEGVRVTSVTSPERLSKASPSAILEGIIRQIGNRVRLIVRLVDSADGSYLWSSRYDRAGGDVFTVQDELSKTIVDELQRLLRPA